MTYIMLKKLLHRYMSGKKFLTPEVWEKLLTQTKSPIPPSPTKVKWSITSGVGEEAEFDTLVNVIHRKNGWRSFMWWFFKTKVLHLKIENTQVKHTNGKRKFKRILSFLFVDKRELFAMKLSFVEFNLVFFTADQSAWLVVLNQPRQRGFCRNLRYILNYMVKENTSLKGNFSC